MTQETRDLLATLDRLTAQLVRGVTSTPVEALDWAPGPETNSVAVLATHALGASNHWLVSIIGGVDDGRDREAEFRALRADLGNVQARAQAWLADARRILEPMTAADLDQPCRRPSTSEGWMAALTARGAVLHVVEHMGMHIGHLELTLQLWQAQHAAVS
jgi:uncharacterized damage-inducible protein DinB